MDQRWVHVNPQSENAVPTLNKEWLLTALWTCCWYLGLTMEIVKEELQLEIPKDAVCIPPIPLPHMHSGFLCLSGGSFYGRGLNDNRGGEMLSTSKSVLNSDSDVTNLTYVFNLIYVSRDLDIQSMAVDMTN